jgi:hypothetical protein
MMAGSRIMPEPACNIVNLADVRRARTRPSFTIIETLAVSEDIEEGQLIALLLFGDVMMFARWLGPTGRAAHGRFVKKGSGGETFQLDSGFTYTADDIRGGQVQILGVVKGGRVVV